MELRLIKHRADLLRALFSEFSHSKMIYHAKLNQTEVEGAKKLVEFGMEITNIYIFIKFNISY